MLKLSKDEVCEGEVGHGVVLEVVSFRWQWAIQVLSEAELFQKVSGHMLEGLRLRAVMWRLEERERQIPQFLRGGRNVGD